MSDQDISDAKKQRYARTTYDDYYEYDTEGHLTQACKYLQVKYHREIGGRIPVELFHEAVYLSIVKDTTIEAQFEQVCNEVKGSDIID